MFVLCVLNSFIIPQSIVELSLLVKFIFPQNLIHGEPRRRTKLRMVLDTAIKKDIILDATLAPAERLALPDAQTIVVLNINEIAHAHGTLLATLKRSRFHARAAIPLAKHALKDNVVRVVGVKVKVRDTTLAGVVDDDLFDHVNTLPQVGRGVKMFFQLS